MSLLIKLNASNLQCIKNETQRRCFPGNFAKFLSNNYFIECFQLAASENGSIKLSN